MTMQTGLVILFLMFFTSLSGLFFAGCNWLRPKDPLRIEPGFGYYIPESLRDEALGRLDDSLSLKRYASIQDKDRDLRLYWDSILRRLGVGTMGAYYIRSNGDVYFIPYHKLDTEGKALVDSMSIKSSI